MDVEIIGDTIRFGSRLTVSLQRTLRVPDDGHSYPLPPGLGRFPTIAVTEDDEASALPGLRAGDAIIPMHQNEALWLGFDGQQWHPSAVQVAAGAVNVFTGEAAEDGLASAPQNYIVCPLQPWLDGINAGEARVRQFVATPLGLGDTIEGQLSGSEHGGIRLTVYEAKQGIFPDTAPPPAEERPQRSSRPMGLGAGGAIVQRVYPDPFGLETWEQDSFGRVTVHILNSLQFEAITGRPAPPSPITAETYTEHGLPWFALYDDELGDIPAAARLAGVRSVQDRQRERGKRPEKDASELHIPEDQVAVLHPIGPRPRSGSPGPTPT